MLRRIFIVAAVATAMGAPAVQAQFANPVVDVAKNAGCGCCEGWIDRMVQAGFTVRPENLPQDELYDLKISRGITEDLMACHTATIAGYTVEGHVPIADIKRLLKEHPNAIGIAVPGMPVGSPGMDPVGAPAMNFGNEKDAYDVLLVRKDGSIEVYASYAGT
jgi:hypothetical protein